MNRFRLLIGVVAMILGGVAARAADEDYVHTFTGFAFPPKVGAFERMKVTPYNAEKSDIQVDYDNADPYTVHGSAYVYPATIPFATHYEDCKAGVLQIHPTARFLNETQVVFDKSGTKYHGREALYELRGKLGERGVPGTPLLSKVILFQRDNYFVLFRISYLKSDQPAAEREIDDFLQKLTWPAGGSDKSGLP